MISPWFFSELVPFRQQHHTQFCKELQPLHFPADEWLCHDHGSVVSYAYDLAPDFRPDYLASSPRSGCDKIWTETRGYDRRTMANGSTSLAEPDSGSTSCHQHRCTCTCSQARILNRTWQTYHSSYWVHALRSEQLASLASRASILQSQPTSARGSGSGLRD